MKSRTAAFLIFGLSVYYLALDTVYFGANFFPRTDAEVIADGLGIIIFSLGLVVLSRQEK